MRRVLEHLICASAFLTLLASASVVDGDSGSGAVFGPFMGESVGIGPALLWSPEFLKDHASNTYPGEENAS
ncbi:hypothetical protein [Enhydrobacter sp.]|jgi:hypothetical protein|uniref:hypothetical protein n=1 Tax=Enhydrobacter sp. TaxID=1894999 RepID=UPI002625770F|nr:hypothetical protein [Enhydrobacter sp.]WIM10524.1 MAG: hypothetical protein OJF58_001480 [Enhydrobacter sp.]